jgi:hypothetical protein
MTRGTGSRNQGYESLIFRWSLPDVACASPLLVEVPFVVGRGFARHVPFSAERLRAARRVFEPGESGEAVSVASGVCVRGATAPRMYLPQPHLYLPALTITNPVLGRFPTLSGSDERAA